MRSGRWGPVFAAATTLLGSVVVWDAPAIAASDNSSDTYAGDYTGGSLPIGTFIALQYLGYVRANAFIDSTGRKLPDGHANIFAEFSRFAYFAGTAAHPLVLEAEIPAATLTDVNIPGTNNLVAGGFTDPVVHATYFFTADAKIQRWLGLTNYVYLPFGRYDNQKTVSVGTAHQLTDVVQIGYTEGLQKFSPALSGVFFDLVANASFHTNGRDPVRVVNPAGAPVPGVLTYDTLTQSTSYDVKAFLRYEPKTFLFVAVGLERSWGGEQIARQGRFAVTGSSVVVPESDLSLSKDDFFRGHIQFQVPFSKDFAVAADIFHDFDRVGGLRNDIGIEIRLTKFFFPHQSPR
jgi:outer membrane putative beta-barrel porin/alpha-amylase